MPRFPRHNIKSKYLHIMTQGHNKGYIFDNEDDIKYYIKLIYESAKEHNVTIIAYCIMNNHSHMLIEAENVEYIGKCMHQINTRYGKYYNKKHNLVGYVFRNRYKSQEIYNEKQFYTCIKYIYDNPVKAGICKDAKDYKFSNYIDTNYEVSNDFVFLETDEDKDIEVSCIIKDILRKNNLGLDDLKDNNYLLKKVVLRLREKELSFRKISEMLGIGKEKVRRIYNEVEKKIIDGE